jgi:hypothetical protein
MASIDRFEAGVFCAQPHAIAGARLGSDGGAPVECKAAPGLPGTLVFSHRLGDNECRATAGNNDIAFGRLGAWKFRNRNRDL